MYNHSKDAAFGSINHKSLSIGYLRPQNIRSKYKNLYYVGDSTYPGNGLPLALMSSSLTSE